MLQSSLFSIRLPYHNLIVLFIQSFMVAYVLVDNNYVYNREICHSAKYKVSVEDLLVSYLFPFSKYHLYFHQN